MKLWRSTNSRNLGMMPPLEVIKIYLKCNNFLTPICSLSLVKTKDIIYSQGIIGNYNFIIAFSFNKIIIAPLGEYIVKTWLTEYLLIRTYNVF